jgi:release factor glutamine methyltransferase
MAEHALPYRQWLQHAAERLQPLYDAAEAKAIARQALMAATGMAAHALALSPNAVPQPHVAAQLAAWLARLQNGEPLQYITGKAYCMGLEFIVTPAVLIPRPETEELIQWTVATVQQAPQQRVLDVGTGGGCIAVALAKLLPQAAITAWDVSADALSVARQNAAHHNVAITFEQVDVLQTAATSGQPFTAIVSNPPYIPPAEAPTLHRNVRDYEPHLALFTPTADALVFYRQLAVMGRVRLTDGGWLLVEVHAPLAEQVVQLFEAEGYANITLRPDLQGRPRMVRAQRA